MRLIDANELYKLIEENSYTLVDRFNSKDKGMFLIGIKEAIDKTPTAYDSDKVVNQLKELKAQDYDDSDEAPEWEDIENVYEDGRSQGRYEAYYNAIEIVKSGGKV